MTGEDAAEGRGNALSPGILVSTTHLRPRAARARFSEAVGERQDSLGRAGCGFVPGRGRVGAAGPDGVCRQAGPVPSDRGFGYARPLRTHRVVTGSASAQLSCECWNGRPRCGGWNAAVGVVLTEEGEIRRSPLVTGYCCRCGWFGGERSGRARVKCVGACATRLGMTVLMVRIRPATHPHRKSGRVWSTTTGRVC